MSHSHLETWDHKVNLERGWCHVVYFSLLISSTMGVGYEKVSLSVIMEACSH